MWKLLLLVAAMPLVLVGVVRLAARIIRFARAHRGEVTAGLLVEELRGQVADALEQWVEEPSPADLAFGDHVDHQPDHAATEAPHGH